MSRPQHVVVEGQRYVLIDLPTLERMCPDGGEITYPEGNGWATSRIGGNRYAAWFARPSELMPEAT